MALRSYGTAAVVAGLHVTVGLLLGHRNRVVEEEGPGEVAHQLLARIVECLNVLEHRHPNVLGTRLHQALEGSDAVLSRTDGRVVEGLDDPDVLLGELLDLHIGDVGGSVGLAGREGCCEVLRMADQHIHGHVAAIGAAAQVDAVAVHVRILRDIPVDAGLEHVGIYGRIVAPSGGAGRRTHPGLRALDGKDVSTVGATFGGEMVLDLRADQGNDLVAEQGDGYVNTTFTTAVQPDDQRVGFAVALEGPGLVSGPGEGFIAHLAGRLAREGTLVEVIGLRDEVLHGLVRRALDGGEFLLADLQGLALLQADGEVVFLSPDAAVLGQADATAGSLLETQRNVFAFRVESTPGVGRIDGDDVAVRAVGVDSEDSRIQDIKLDFRLDHHEVDDGGGFIRSYTYDGRFHFQRLGAGGCTDSQSYCEKYELFHDVLAFEGGLSGISGNGNGIGELLGIHPLEEVVEALRSDGAATVVGRLHVTGRLLLRGRNLVVEHISPGEVAHEPLAGRIGADHVLEHGDPDVLGAGADQTLVGRNAVFGRPDRRIVERLDEPDVLTGKLLDLHVGDVDIGISLASGVGCSEETGVPKDHVHGHVTAVGAAADIDTVRIDIRIGVDVVVDAGFEDIGIEGRIGTAAEALRRTHPHGRALDGQHIGALVAAFGREVGLDVVADQGNDLVTHQFDGNVGAAFAHAVEPDDERVLLAVDPEGFRLIGSPGQGLVARTARRRTGEGAATEEIGLGKEVAERVVRGAVHRRVLLAAGLDALAGLEGDLHGISRAPGSHASGYERGNTPGIADLETEGEVVAIVGPLTAVVASVDDLHVPFNAVGFDGKYGRIQRVKLHLGLDNHEIDGGGGLIGVDAGDLMGHLQGLGTSRCCQGHSQSSEDEFDTFHRCLCMILVFVCKRPVNKNSKFAAI